MVAYAEFMPHLWFGVDAQQGPFTCSSVSLLYVENPPPAPASIRRLLGRRTVEYLPTFAMLPLSDGVMLGCGRARPSARRRRSGRRQRNRVHVDDAAAEGDVCRLAAARIEDHPATRANGFGHTFVAADPGTGHRLRVFAPAAMNRNWVAVASAEHVRIRRRGGSCRSVTAAVPLKRTIPATGWCIIRLKQRLPRQGQAAVLYSDRRRQDGVPYQWI